MAKKSGKGTRLFKVSKELNLAKETLVQHLRDQGFTLEDTSMNAVLTDEMHQHLLQHFAKDKEAASRHEKMVQEIRTRQEEESRVAEDVEVEDEIEEPAEAEEAPIETTAPQEEEEGYADQILSARPDEQPVEGPDTTAPERKVFEPVAEREETVEVDLVEAKEEASAEAAVHEEEEAGVEEPVEEEPVAEAETKEEIEEMEEEPVEEEPAVDEALEGEPEEMATISAGRYRLSGPKVIGKVDLAGIQESASKTKKKRKRKRKTKETVEDAVPAKKVVVDDADSAARRKKKKRRQPAVDESAVEQAISETKRELDRGTGRTRQRRRRLRREERAAERQREVEEEAAHSEVIRVMEFSSASELANLMDVPVTSVIQTCLELGMMVSINQRLDADTITLIADEFGHEVDFVTEIGAEDITIEEDDPEDLVPRAPVVTIMGHVDHGKTSLLDYIRKSSVVAGEAGGITQHIGAYEVELPDGRQIAFLDTPGHEAFTAMRARGAQVTDIVILVVAADDSVMPQTIEAINHAKAAGVPMVVAINKIDKPASNPQRIMQQLADHSVLVEQYGGKVQCSLVSAHTGEATDDLLDKVLLEAELLDLKGNPDRKAVGTVIESKLDKGRGIVATVLVETGTLRVGDVFVAGLHSGRVRAMFDERDNRLTEAGPSRPALVLGFSGSPEVGDRFVVLEEERDAREVAQKRQQIHREQAMRQRKHITLDDIGRRLALGEFQELNLIVKADVGGSVEALSDSLLKLSTDEVSVNIIHSGVGAITESDVMLASASDAVIIGFQVRPTANVRKIAEHEEIDIRLYSIIYDAIADLRDAMEGMLSPEQSDKILGLVEVREIFKVPKVGTVAGSYVLEGKIRRSDKVRLIRDGVVVYDGRLASLKRFKDDVREVTSGYECGLSIENYNDVKVGDHVESYEIVETKRKLEV